MTSTRTLIYQIFGKCLVYYELPFADDWRQFEFAPIVTSKNQPSQEQLDVIDQLIDKLDLSEAEK